MAAEVDYHGVCILKVDGADFLDPYDRSVARVPEITSVAMTSTVQLPLSDTDVASVGGAWAGSFQQSQSRFYEIKTPIACIVSVAN